MLAKLFASLLLILLLSGCPRASWYIEPAQPAAFVVNDSCIRQLNNFDGVYGIVKLHLDYIDSGFQRYLIETTYGVANLDVINGANNDTNIADIKLYYSGSEKYPVKNQTQLQNYIETLLQQLQRDCLG